MNSTVFRSASAMSAAIIIVMLWMPQRAALAILKIDGNTVTENGDEYDELTNEGGDLIRTEIFGKMVASLELFSFSDVDHAGQHFDVREDICRAMKEMNNGAIDWDYGGGNYEVVDDVFELYDPDSYNFHIKSGLSASLGIGVLINDKTRTECWTARCGAVLIGHQRIMGEPWIDGKIASGQLKVDWEEGEYFVQDAIDSLPDDYIIANAGDETKKLIPGDLFYLKNDPNYLEMTAARQVALAVLAILARDEAAFAQVRRMIFSYQGENFIYLGNGKSSGLGLDNLTINEARDVLADFYESDTGGVPPNRTTMRVLYQQRPKIYPYQP